MTECSEGEYHCALVVDDQSLSARQVAQIVHNMSEVYPESEFVGLQKIGRARL